MFVTDLLIAGQARPASNGAAYERRTPATGAVATRAAAATLDDVDAAVAAAHAAFPGWSAMPPSARRALLLGAAEAMESLRGRIVEAATSEAGGAPAWHRFNVTQATNMLRDAAAATARIADEFIPSDVPGSLAMGVRQPCGAVVGIAPGSAPVALGTRAIAMPLACGNTVILKASERCPAVHRLIAQAFVDAGFPSGVVNFLSNAPDDAARVVERLVAHPAVRRINFTGSARVGRIIAQLAAAHLKPVLLQLCGGNPVVVLDDADLDAAVDAAVFSAFFNHGQSHMSVDRIIVDRKIAIAFVEKLATQTTALLTARASMPLAGRVVPADDSRVCTMPDLRMRQDESSGPLPSVLRFDTDEEAILLANDNAYGPSASVFSRNVGRAMAVARRIESGTCHINGPIVHDEAQMQFGGVQGSGYGHFNSKAAIAEFTDLRWITLQRGPSHHPIRGGRHA